MTNTQDPANARRGQTREFLFHQWFESLTTADVDVGDAWHAGWRACEERVRQREQENERLRQEKAALLELLHRMVEHLEHCSDTWTPSDLLLADLRAVLAQAKPESP